MLFIARLYPLAPPRTPLSDQVDGLDEDTPFRIVGNHLISSAQIGYAKHEVKVPDPLSFGSYSQTAGFYSK